MARLAGSYAYGLIVAAQPLLVFREQLSPVERGLGWNPERSQMYRQYYAKLIQAASVAAERHQASFRDLTRMFSGLSGGAFYDSVHFDGENAAVREVVRDEFVKLILSHPGACDVVTPRH